VGGIVCGVEGVVGVKGIVYVCGGVWGVLFGEYGCWGKRFLVLRGGVWGCGGFWCECEFREVGGGVALVVEDFWV